MAKSINIFSFSIIFYLALYSPAACFKSNQTHLLSLLALKEAVDVDPNGALNSWNRTTNFCTWNIVTCGRRQPNRVVGIKLDSQGLMGSLSPHICNLSFLREINLQINISFSGPFPQEIGLLRRLEYIEFSNNSFMGTIMPGNITQWKNLIRYLEKLRDLGLAKNKISGEIPRFIGNVTSLRTLYLRSCGLEGEIPESISQLKRPSNLNLGDNNLTCSIPSGLFNISTIEQFVVDFNGLHGSIPSTIGLTLPNLSFLSLGRNRFSGRVLISISNASSLESLVLSFNDFTGPMLMFGGILLFSSLYAEKTLVQDDFSFVSSLTNCTNLRAFDLSSLFISRQIPECIRNLSVNLAAIRISDTQLRRKIPSDKLFNVNILNLTQNWFTGDIPSLFGNLSSITKLNLYENNFSGAIPKSLGKCTNMLELNLLRTVDLVMLDFSNNRLSGLIPNSLGTCISLERLYLEGNLFEGQIPQGLSPLVGLRYLDLSRNNLSGTIPSFLGLLRLEQLNLSINMLQEQVPTTGVLKNKTITSLQGNKELCRGILEFDLPPCTTSSSKKNLSTRLKIAIPKEHTKKVLPSLPSFMGTQFLRLSYSDLLKATGGFAETSLVGVGSFGYVYKGVLDDGVTVIAVKVLNLVVKGASKSFLAECNSLRGIRHKNLVKILSVCERIDFQGNDFKALVYEFKANGSLDKWLYYNGEQEEGSDAQLRNLDLIERLDIAIDVAHALEYLHSGIGSVIVHGNLNPSNILLDEEKTACVGDFGLSKIVSSVLPPRENSSTIGIKGTIGYVPPEYGMSNAISAEGDVYSYGILVLEMFTKKRPTDDSFMDQVNLHNFVDAALPDHVMEILDPLVRIGPRQNNNMFEDCMSCILNIS
ncbi:hypothetical protein ABFX02_07G083900 [Erythranthe guttata]